MLETQMENRRPPAPSYLIPDLVRFETVVAYFREFYRLNQGRSEFSYRKFAEVIGWPYSYLNDLAAGRKPLTLARALEFAHLVRMTVPETERFILISLKSSENQLISDYFSRQFELGADLNKKISPDTFADKPTAVEVRHDIGMDAGELMLLAVIAWLKGSVTKASLEKIAKFLPHIHGTDTVENRIEKLVALGLVKLEEDRVTYLNDVYFTKTPAALQVDAEIMLQILRESESRKSDTPTAMKTGAYRTGMVEFPVQHLPELQQRLYRLANWIGHINQTYRQRADYCPENNPLIKYDLFFVPLIPEKYFPAALAQSR